MSSSPASRISQADGSWSVFGLRFCFDLAANPKSLFSFSQPTPLTLALSPRLRGEEPLETRLEPRVPLALHPGLLSHPLRAEPCSPCRSPLPLCPSKNIWDTISPFIGEPHTCRGRCHSKKMKILK